MNWINRARISKRVLLVAGALALLTCATHAPSAMAGPGAAYFEAGHKLAAEGNAALGLRYVATSLALEPTNFATQVYFVTMLDQTRFRDDVAVMEQLRLILPTYVPLIERLARLYEGKQRQAEAGQIYEAWRALRPDSAEAQARAGEHYRFTGQHEKAVEAFTQYLNVVEESDYAVNRIVESAALAAVDRAVETMVAKAAVVDANSSP